METKGATNTKEASAYEGNFEKRAIENNEIEKPKRRGHFSTKKVVGMVIGLSLIVLAIGALLLFSSSLNFFRNSPFSPMSYSQEELVNYTLSLINSNRNGVVTNPNGTIDTWISGTGEQYPQNVSLSSVGSAQQHADDMLENHYFSHWDTNGYKPYMRYTLFGGNGSVTENIAWYYSSGPFDAKDAIETLEWQMMEEDAQWNWGHRDNIIDPFHNMVSLGIAYDNNNLYLVEDFENDYITWSTRNYSGSEVTMDGTLTISGLSISDVEIYYDKVVNLTTQQLANSPYNGSYDMGTFVGMVVPPGWQSTNGITITAGTWSQTGQDFQIGFDLSPAFAQFGSGVYTLYMTTQSDEFLTSFSVWN